MIRSGLLGKLLFGRVCASAAGGLPISATAVMATTDANLPTAVGLRNRDTGVCLQLFEQMLHYIV
jgi:hypothetical protein